MKKRAIVASLQGTQQQVEALLLTVNEAKAKLGQIDELANKLGWVTGFVDSLVSRIDEAERLVVEVERRDEAAVFEQVRVRVNEMLEGAERRFEGVEAVKVEAERKAKVLDGMKERMERLNIPELGKNVAWLIERVNMLATRLEGMRGNVTLDDAAAQRLTFAVGQFAARLDRLEAPKPPRKRPRVTSDKPPAIQNGTTETAK